MKKYSIANKGYQPIVTAINGRQFIIPQKGAVKTVALESVPKNLVKLQTDGLITISEVKE